MDQVEQAVDNLDLKAAAVSQLNEVDATPGQIKYVHILNEYEKELMKLEQNYTQTT
jgi:hypothetical protein